MAIDLRFTYYIKTNVADSTTFTAHVVYIDPGGRVLNPLASDRDVGDFADLAITAQYTPGMGAEDWYGFHVAYVQPYQVHLEQAERMVKRLRKTHKALDRLDEKFGRTVDLAGFCGRVADAIGCIETAVFSEYSRELTINGTHYRWTDVDGLRYRLAKIAKEATV
jgi:hypothetical protein